MHMRPLVPCLWGNEKRSFGVTQRLCSAGESADSAVCRFHWLPRQITWCCDGRSASYVSAGCVFTWWLVKSVLQLTPSILYYHWALSETCQRTDAEESRQEKDIIVVADYYCPIRQCLGRLDSIQGDNEYLGIGIWGCVWALSTTSLRQRSWKCQYHLR